VNQVDGVLGSPFAVVHGVVRAVVEDDAVLQNLAHGGSLVPLGGFQESSIGKWFGQYYNQIEIIARGNLLYNEAQLAQSNIGAVIGIKLNCNYEKLKFIPMYPIFEHGTALVWKKEQIFSSATSSFIDFSIQYFKSITDDKL